MRNFHGSFVFTAIALLLAGWAGYADTGTILGILGALWLVSMLGAMETTVSFDNAVVNATVLKDMDEKWQRRFLTWGIAIAVFGMRVIFPLAIVSVAAWVTPWEALTIALSDHERYEQIITGAHVGIAGYGGAFLAIVAQQFFFDKEKEHHWLHWIEAPLMKLAAIPFAAYVLTLVEIAAIAAFLPYAEAKTFLIAGVSGVATYGFVHWIQEWLGGADEHGNIVRSSAGSFIYLEFLDATFSFDGVIAAFAITNNIIYIALGLGIGAMFVRSMTIALVRGGTLSEYKFLEHGAFYAIAALAAIMLLGPVFHTPEVVVGLVGAIFIGAAVWSSIRWRRKQQATV